VVSSDHVVDVPWPLPVQLPNTRVLTHKPGRIVFAFLASAWALLLATNLVQTAHAYPDYGDLLRWVYQFLTPLAEADEPKLWAALFSEYEFPGHGHVLTKSMLLLVSQFASFDLHMLRLTGTTAYAGLLVLLMHYAWKEMKRSQGGANWWALTLLLMLFTHPDDYSFGNNLLAFEYTFILLAWLMVVAVYRYLRASATFTPVVAMTLLGALFADIAFTLALGSSFALAITALVAKECTLRRAYPLIALLLLTPVIILLAGAEDNSSNMLSGLDLRRLLQWTSAGLGSGLLSESFFLSRGLSQAEIYKVSLLLGAPILCAILLTGVDQLVYRRPCNLGIALVVFGLLSLVGTYVTRNELGDYYVISPRYVRYSTFALFGLGWYWLIVRAPTIQDLASKASTRLIFVLAWLLIATVYVWQLYEYRRATTFFEAHHKRVESSLREYAFGESEPPKEILGLLPVVLRRDHPEDSRSTVRAYFECRDDVSSCTVGRSN